MDLLFVACAMVVAVMEDDLAEGLVTLAMIYGAASGVKYLINSV